jgi:hypothetical protein
MCRFPSPEIHRWIEDYKAANAALLGAEPGFRRWLDEEYAPIGGGWQY